MPRRRARNTWVFQAFPAFPAKIVHELGPRQLPEHVTGGGFAAASRPEGIGTSPPLLRRDASVQSSACSATDLGDCGVHMAWIVRQNGSRHQHVVRRLGAQSP